MILASLIPKALEYCTLGHVLSLWETLSVELAKLLTLTDQVHMLYMCPNPHQLIDAWSIGTI